MATPVKYSAHRRVLLAVERRSIVEKEIIVVMLRKICVVRIIKTVAVINAVNEHKYVTIMYLSGFAFNDDEFKT